MDSPVARAKHARPRGRHQRLFAGLLVLAGLLVAGRLALNPWVSTHTRDVLSSLKGYRGDFDDVSISLLHLSYSIDGLKLVQVPTPPGADVKRPYFYARHIGIGLHLRELIQKRELVAAVDLEGPKMNIIAGKTKETSQTKVGDPELGAKLQRLSPLEVQRIQVTHAELAFSDQTGKGSPSLWFHDLDGTVENLATRRGLSHGEPTTVAASGTLQKTGQVSLFITADPLDKALAFSGRAAVEGLDVHDVGNFLVQKADLTPEEGSIDIFAEFDAHDGRIAGGVKPVLKNIHVGSARSGVGPQLKAWIADAGLRLLSDRVPKRHAVAAVVPFQGTIDSPQAQLWPTIWAALRNAFVAGLQSGFAQLPPQDQAQKQDVLPQARRAASGGARR